MHSIATSLQLAAAACIGVFTGAMLTELFVLVPWWRSLAPAEFFRWYAANDRRLLGYFGPVTAVTAVVAVAASAVAFWTGQQGRWWEGAASALVLVTVAMFTVYFEAANAGFSAATIPAADLPAELARWEAWHRARTVLCVVALALSIAALPVSG